MCAVVAVVSARVEFVVIVCVDRIASLAVAAALRIHDFILTMVELIDVSVGRRIETSCEAMLCDFRVCHVVCVVR